MKNTNCTPFSSVTFCSSNVLTVAGPKVLLDVLHEYFSFFAVSGLKTNKKGAFLLAVILVTVILVGMER